MLKSLRALALCLLSVWSEWKPPNFHGLAEICTPTCEGFNGIDGGCHKAELIQQPGWILGSWTICQGTSTSTPKVTSCAMMKSGLPTCYEGSAQGLKRTLQEVDQEVMEILNAMPSGFTFLLTGPHGLAQNPTTPIYEPCPSYAYNLTSGVLNVIPSQQFCLLLFHVTVVPLGDPII